MSVIHVKSQEQYTSNINKQWVVVDFSAEWCGPCKRIAPTYEKLAEQNPDVVFLHIDVDEVKPYLEDVVKVIESLPTFYFLKNGTKVNEFAGASEDKLRQSVAGLKAT